MSSTAELNGKAEQMKGGHSHEHSHEHEHVPEREHSSCEELADDVPCGCCHFSDDFDCDSDIED